MALTPLEVEVLDGGAPVDGATIEVRNHLRASAGPLSPTGYDDQGAALSDPVLTDSTGGVPGGIWLPNGLYDWRWSFGGFTSGWRSFPAYRGRGREFYDESTPAAALPATDTITVPSGGVDNNIGGVEVTLDFADDHMGQAMIVLVPPSAPARGPLSLSGTALDGLGAPLVGAAVDVRNAVTASSVTPTDSGGTPLGSFDTDGSGNPPSGYVPLGIYEWRVATSANLSAWMLVVVGAPGMGAIWSGPDNVAFNGLVDYAFDGTVTFTTRDDFDVAAGVAFADGDRVESGLELVGLASDGAWALWIAGGTGTLRGWTLELLSV
jgi:hypothetical protein